MGVGREHVYERSRPGDSPTSGEKRSTGRGVLMGTFAEFSITGLTFPWGAILDSYQSVTVEIERAVPFGVPVYYCWIGGQGHEQASQELCDASGGCVVTLADELLGRTLVRVEKCDSQSEFFRIVDEANALVLSITGKRKRWSVTLHFPDSGTVSAFHEQCYDHGISAQLKTVYNADPRDRTSLYGLTPEQFETLREAHRQGYFEIPRETTIAELAERFEISDQAVSERLRRALTTLVGSTLVDGDWSTARESY